MKKRAFNIVTLFDHQNEAVSGTLEELSVADRCKVIMACGTGKTKVGVQVAIELNPATVVVYLPSLALMRQTLPDWIRASFKGGVPDILCVCSDDSVGDSDDAAVTSEELASEFHTPVTSSAQDVHRFLSGASNHVRVVFSTYQSSDVVSEGCPDDFTFDVGLFDEAHRTAGEHGMFTGPLLDTHTRIAKRVFMTATPKHYNIRKNDATRTVAFSMDDERVYGRVAYHLPIQEAIRRGIITDYRVLITVVDDKTIGERLKSKSAKGNVEHAAHAIAIKDAMNKYGITKVVTFHDSVSDAKNFAENAVVQKELNAPTFHVSGSVKTSIRSKIMQQFASEPEAMVTNARCLTEGVDVPSIDLVAFMHPKKSKVDIIQAIGRALRLDRSRNKTTGYVLLPIYVSDLENGGLEEALRETGYDSIIKVIQAIKEQDDAVEASFREAAQNTREEERSLDYGMFHISGPAVHVEKLRKAISSLCMEYLIDGWLVRYGEIKEYFNQNGNSDVPLSSVLGTWCGTQRKYYKDGKLSTEQIEKLNAVDFKFDVIEELWKESYEELKSYFFKNGNSDVVTTEKLGGWCHNQRKRHKAGKLSAEKIKALNEINFKFNVTEDYWNEKYAELEEYFSVHGNSDVITGSGLGLWCSSMRKSYKKGTLTEDKIQKLKSLNFKFNMLDDSWQESYEALMAYFNENKNTYPSDGSSLGRWCKHQRTLNKKGKLSTDKIESLNAINFRFNTVIEVDFKKQRTRQDAESCIKSCNPFINLQKSCILVT